MKMGWVRALLLAVAAMAACGKSESSGGTGDAGLHGPTHLVAKWTFTGKPASASECSARMGAEVFVTLSATIDPSLHKTATVDCEKGTFDFGSPRVEDLGMPYVEAALLDDKGVTIATASADVSPTPGSTTVTLDFFPAMNTGGAGGAGSTSSSSTTTSSSTSSSTSGMGGAGGMGGGGSSSTTTTSSTSSSMGGMGGMGGMMP
jgi:hypothetical protein